MSKKYTIRDIAKQAGVSVATVSYVINNREDQRISAQTKKKVWQIINLLDYKPNSSAKSLATNKTFHVVLYLAHETSLYKRSEQLFIAEELSKVLRTHGYHLILQSDDDITQIDYADAILCYDISSELFQEIGEKNFIPLIALDSLIDNPLEIFFQICYNYADIKQKADHQFGQNNYTYLCLTPHNTQVRDMILKTFDRVIFIKNSFVQVPGNQVISQNCLSSLYPDASFISCDMQAKINQIYTCIDWAINRIPDREHIIFV